MRFSDLLHEHSIRILDSIFDGILIIDADSTVIYVNPEYLRIVKIEASDIIGKPLRDVRPGAMLPDVVRSGIPVEGAYRREGDVEYVVDMSPFFYEGKVVGGISVVKDITEVQRLSKELARFQRSNKQLRSSLRRINAARHTFADILGTSSVMLEARQKAAAMAASTADILITGESGTGKEVFAQAMHNASPRSRGPFLALNCATLSPNFIESELFGYADGAFTGAKRGGKEGFFEVANGGTLFLDEVTELSTESQAKLLRVLQEKAVRRVGETDEIPMDVRVIAASNRNMVELVANGLFRSDLFYRLNALHLEIPPLRHRGDDILILADFFARKVWKQSAQSCLFAPDAIAALRRYPWPGNVRELRNAIEYATHMGFTERITPSRLPANIVALHGVKTGEPVPAPDGAVAATARPLAESLAEMEKKIILAGLNQCGESLLGKKKLAKELGISLTTLYAKISRHGL